MRSGASRVTLCTVASAFSMPDTTRNSVMRPANWSATVFHTHTTSGTLSLASRVAASPFEFWPEKGRSLGAGT